MANDFQTGPDQLFQPPIRSDEIDTSGCQKLTTLEEAYSHSQDTLPRKTF